MRQPGCRCGDVCGICNRESGSGAPALQSRSERRRDAGIVADYIGAVRRVHYGRVVKVEARRVDGAVAGDNVARRIDTDDLVVELVADQSVAIGQTDCARRRGSWIAACTGIREEMPKVGTRFISFANTAVIQVRVESIP